MSGSSDKRCTCPDGGHLDLPVDIKCPKCGGRLMTREEVERLASIEAEITGDCPGRLPDGALRVAAGTHSRAVDEGKRNTIKLLVGSILAATVGGVLAIPLGLIIKMPQMDEKARLDHQAMRITIDDIRAIERALQSAELPSIASQYRLSNRHAVARLIDAVSGHVSGMSPQHAARLFDEVLRSDLEQDVERFVRFHRAKLLALIGLGAEGLLDLEKVISLASDQDPREKVKYLRQAMNHAYICIPREHVLEPSQWMNLRQYLSNALDIIGVSAKSLQGRMQQAMLFDEVLGPGVLMFEALINAAEAKESPHDCDNMLDWHLELIAAMQRGDPITGWNRYTPLAAQAVALGRFQLADKVLRQANKFTTSSSDSAISRYAAMQHQNRSTEWLFQRVIAASLNIAKGNLSRRKERIPLLKSAREELKEPLSPSNAVRTVLFQRAAKLYQLATFEGASQSTHDEFCVAALNMPATTHWTYLPNVPKLSYSSQAENR